MFNSSRHFSRRLAGLGFLLLATLARAQVTITCDQAQVTSRTPCVLTAAHADGLPRTWRWGVVGMDDASQLLEPIAPDRVRVRTPVALVERSFTVVAEDAKTPSVAGTFVLRITPNPAAGSGERALAEGIFPDAFTPSLVPFLGHPEKGRTAAAGDPRQIAFCDDSVMGALDRCWLLAKGPRLEAFKVAGDPVAVPGFSSPSASGSSCIAVATLPPGPGEVPAGAPRVVFCEMDRPPERGVRIYALEPDGRKRFLAGGGESAQVDGPGGSARFRYVLGLALDRGGNVYVKESFSDTVRKIGLDGQVSTLAPRDSQGGEISFARSGCLVVDPATGDLYVGGSDGLVMIPPKGAATRLIGGRGRALASRFEDASAALVPGRVPRDTAFGMNPDHLALHGRELFMAGQDGITAFHLDTRRLVRILASNPNLQANRMGPVPFLNPHLPASKCAAIQGCGAMALTKEAMCILVVGQGIAELELPDDPVTSIMDPPKVERKDHFVAHISGGGTAAAPKDSLWPGPDLETLVVPAAGHGEVTHWRSAAPGQRFAGQCRVETRSLSHGQAQIRLEFVNQAGAILAHTPAGQSTPDRVSAPIAGQTLLSTAWTAPAGTHRVGFSIRVDHGNPGGAVSFRDVMFNQAP